MFTRSWGDQGDGPYEGRFKIADIGSNLGGALSIIDEQGDGVLLVVAAVRCLVPEPPLQCSYAVYGEEDFPKDCDSWKQVCCPASAAMGCDETAAPFD